MKTLIISDIHGNFPASEAVLERKRIFDQCIFLGDVVDYGPFPKERISFLRDTMSHGVIGNHDNALGSDVDCGCRGEFKQVSDETGAWTLDSPRTCDARGRSLPVPIGIGD